MSKLIQKIWLMNKILLIVVIILWTTIFFLTSCVTDRMKEARKMCDPNGVLKAQVDDNSYQCQEAPWPEVP